ncbi:hypothetical protein J437_LFUL019753 [Ladona fulva]|nr:hypothetical protein J437_LFUL019753 [Ladona fulva]
MNSWRNAECEKVLPKEGDENKTSGHCVSRCSLSLIQCLDLPYRICYICGALAREKLIHDDVPVCVFCNGRMCVDDRVSS